ncbi:oocyst wall protein OWP3 [Cryptosporidium felis]|nr:oocyst wall protein OWP3 [Cryptosporidium felis]
MFAWTRTLATVLLLFESFFGAKSQLPGSFNVVDSRSVCRDSEVYDRETDSCLVKVNALSKSCPKNCQKFGHLCKCIDEMSIQPICPSEYVLSQNSKKCVREERLAPLLECGRGLKWSESRGLCVGVRVSAPELTCSKENSVLINGVCLTYEKKSVQNVCEEGFVKKERVPEASPNLKLNTRGVRSGSQSFAPEDSKMAASYCVKEMASEYSLECPPGFLLEKESSACIAQIFSDPEPLCLAGFEYDGKSEICVKKSLGEPSGRVCPKDYVLEGFQCVQSSFVSPEPRCREGFVFNVEEGACIKILREPPSYRCPSDLYIFDGKQCELRRTEKSTIMCGNGSVLDEKLQKCLKLSVVPAKMSCSGGRQYDEAKKKCYVIQVQESSKVCPPDERFDPGRDKCVKFEQKKPTKGCPYGFVLNESEQVCVQENFEEPRLSCKSPFALVGGDCLYDAQVEPEYVCPENFEYDSSRAECFMQSSVQPENGCPEDYNEYIDKCIKQIEKNPVSVCPANSRLNSITNECFASKKPLKECPVGFKPTNESATKCVQAVHHQSGVGAQGRDHGHRFHGPSQGEPPGAPQALPVQLASQGPRRIGESGARQHPQNIKTAPRPRR